MKTHAVAAGGRLRLLAVLWMMPAVAMAVPRPTVEGPVTGGLGSPVLVKTTFDLADVGYSVAEYFISGTASAYLPVDPLTPDGHWTVAPAASAPYKTRILVYRPARPGRFNGTVVVEWLNVTAGIDIGVEWVNTHVELIREGFAWVGVSAQIAGVEGGGLVIPGGAPPMPLKTADPERYGSLSHPGDSFSYDIFSQAGEAVRHPDGVALFGGRPVRAVIAVGESQSAYRLENYINAIQPLTRTFDGFLVHSRGSFGVFLSERPQPVVPVPSSILRTDLDAPVLMVETETDLVNALFGLLFLPVRQDDTDRVRTWEVAGTSHVDAYLNGAGLADLGDSPGVGNLVVTTATPFGNCTAPINAGPQHFVLNAAMRALDRWVRRGVAPPVAPRLEAVTSPAIAIVRNQHGNALGGVRTPQVDVPIATLSGEGQAGGPFACGLDGTTVPFSAQTLRALYPTHAAFATAFRAATTAAERAGFLVRRDARLLRRWAAGSTIGR